jgi:hypothetical protein
VFALPGRVRLGEAILFTMGLSMALFVAAGVLFNSLGVPHGQDLLLSLLTAAPTALAVGWLRYRGRYFKIALSPDLVEIYRGGHGEQILPSEIQAVIGLGGFAPGEQGFVWRRLVILSRDRTHTLVLQSQDNARCYDALLRFCPSAWGLPFRGELDCPMGMGAPAGDSELTNLASLTRLYRRQAVTTILLATALLVVCLGVGVWMFNEAGIEAFLGAVHGLGALAGVGLTWLLVKGGYDLRVLTRLRQTQGLTDGY